jgi:hypothetical protein
MSAVTFPNFRIISAAARWHSSNSARRKMLRIRITKRRSLSIRISIDMEILPCHVAEARQFVREPEGERNFFCYKDFPAHAEALEV